MKYFLQRLYDIFSQADHFLLALCCGASFYGLLMIYSATRWTGSNRYILVQFAALVLGVVAYFLISLVDMEKMTRRWWIIVCFNVGLILLLRSPFGVSDGTGNLAWLKFPFLPVSIGPAEIVKITFVLLLAKQLAWIKEENMDMKSMKVAVFAAGHAFAIAGLYFLISKDMGNALMFILIFVVVAFFAGFPLRWFALLFGGLAAGVGGAYYLNLIPTYMMERFYVLLDHDYDPLRTGWQQRRSVMTIGSGGFFGQGYMKGAQTQGGKGTLPARHTDLIFSVIGEEMGFVGALLVFVLLGVIVYRILVIAKKTNSLFYSNICVGMAAMIFFQAVINLGMCLFVLPVIGLTLPFFSYGGSSLVTLFAAIGFVSAVKLRTPFDR